jgi:hypothetical protein
MAIIIIEPYGRHVIAHGKLGRYLEALTRGHSLWENGVEASSAGTRRIIL